MQSDDITRQLCKLRQAVFKAQLRVQADPNSQDNRIDLERASDALRAELQELLPIIDTVQDYDRRALARLVWLDGYSVDQVAQALGRARSGLYRHMDILTRYVVEQRTAQEGKETDGTAETEKPGRGTQA